MKALALAAALWCAAAAAQEAGKPVHVASDEVVAGMSEDEAKLALAELSRRRGFVGLGVFGPSLEAFSRPSWVLAIETGPERLLVRHEKGEITVAISRFEVIEDSVMGTQQYGVPVSENEVLWALDGSFTSDGRRSNAIRLANALQALKRAGTQAATIDAQFAQLAAQYRGASPKPALPEDVRRARVQAEFAVDHRRFADAARFYAEGIAAAPWWAAGYFNRALVLAEAGRHAEAIRDMRRYLALEPTAQDSRTAQDMVYRWESVAPPVRQAAPAAAPSSPGGSLLFRPMVQPPKEP